MYAIDEIIQKLNKDHKEILITKGLSKEVYPRIPFSSPKANYMLYGGIPRGRLVEFCGKFSSGKTTLSLDVVAQAQRLFKYEYDNKVTEFENRKLNKTEEVAYNQLLTSGKKLILFVDVENTLDTEWASTLGVDVDDIILYVPQAQSAGQILQDIIDLIETGHFGLVIIDSLSMLVSEAQLDADIGKDIYRGNAKDITMFTKKAIPLCGQHKTTVLGINTVKPVLGGYAGQTYRPGGEQWQLGVSVCIELRAGSVCDEYGIEITDGTAKSTPCGTKIQMHQRKTKICRPDRKLTSFTLNFTDGIDVVSDVIDVAKDFGLINRAGSWYELLLPNGDSERFQGGAKLYEYMRANLDVFNLMYDNINKLVMEVN